jgi:hypothetical protein
MMRTTVTPHCHALVSWLRRRYALLVWAGLALAFVHPPGGLGVCVCVFRSATGVPCLGCGLTRSLSCTLRGEVVAAWSYHPFGPVAATVLVLIGVLGILPRPAHVWLAGAIARRQGLADALRVALVGSFLLYGVARALMYAWGAGRAAPLLN